MSLAELLKDIQADINMTIKLENKLKDEKFINEIKTWIHAVEGTDAPWRGDREHPHPLHEWVHLLGNHHCMRLCVYHVSCVGQR